MARPKKPKSFEFETLYPDRGDVFFQTSHKAGENHLVVTKWEKKRYKKTWQLAETTEVPFEGTTYDQA